MIRRKPRRRRRQRRIADETPILPEVVADTVIGEVACYLGYELQDERRLADQLATRADTVYSASDHFRKIIRKSGNRGRDSLYSFMRHWLGSELREKDPKTFRKLPDSFTWPGQALPKRCLWKKE